jgi:hypothetical protein
VLLLRAAFDDRSIHVETLTQGVSPIAFETGIIEMRQRVAATVPLVDRSSMTTALRAAPLPTRGENPMHARD